MEKDETLYARMGGYEAISAVADDLLPRLMADTELGRFWAYRGTDGLQREKQMLINFLCAKAGGPILYTGRSMKTSHQGMRISDDDWSRFVTHLKATLQHFNVPEKERQEVLAFIESSRGDIVEQ